MTPNDLEIVRCPECGAAVKFRGSRAGDEMADGELRCAGGHCWAVRDGLPHMVEDAQVRGLDRIMRLTYDWFGALHDPAVEYLLPVLQCEGIDRNNYIRRLELGDLRPVRGRPLRILDVGLGGGANLPLIEAALPKGVDVELWGVDLSSGMLAQCRRRIAATPPRNRVRLMLADAHALPFADGTFDRVLHTGAINAYNDPRRGLAEMARVARPDVPIVVLDEQLDPHREHGLYPRLMFGALTFFDPCPRSPRALLPAEAIKVRDEQASRFYYCLSFRMPQRVDGLSAGRSKSRPRLRAKALPTRRTARPV